MKITDTSPPNIKTIALVEWQWHGHHATYYALFLSSLAKQNCNVLALCPNPEETKRHIHKKYGSDFGKNITYVNLSKINPPLMSQKTAGYYALTHILTFLKLSILIRKHEKTIKEKIDFLYYSCIYDTEFKYFKWIEPIIRRKWSGLYLHCKSFHNSQSESDNSSKSQPPDFFRSERLHSLSIIDESAETAVAEYIRCPVKVIPDFSNLDTNTDGTDLSKSIRQFAGSRPIVLLAGHLQRSKGCETLVKCIREGHLNDHTFAFVGNIWWDSFPKDIQDYMQNEMQSATNVFCHFQRISELEFNTVVQTSDVVFGAYLDFPNSSNLMTKAAAFRKPIIVSSGYLMAQRAAKYRLGETIPEGDHKAAEMAIRKITNDPDEWISTNEPKWPEYTDAHSVKHLDETVQWLVSKI